MELEKMGLITEEEIESISGENAQIKDADEVSSATAGAAAGVAGGAAGAAASAGGAAAANH
ncbi:MAG: hypothetical protein K5744_12715 [Eubacterium sp.]|nr:hypothetical protein [Eubacterium sp.]